MTPQPKAKPARRFGLLLATLVAVTYLVVAWISSRYVRVGTWDMRALESHIIDYAWQMELAFRAHNGEWSGRDFHFPMGPGWQLVAYLGSLPGPFVPEKALAGLEGAFRLLGTAAAALIAWRFVRPGFLRLWAFLLIATLSYGAGVATFRSVVSVATILAYAPRDGSDATPSYASAFASAALCLVGLSLSPDRFVFAGVGILAVFVVELLARRRRQLALAPALQRLGRFVVALGALSAAVWLLALLVGASPVTYLKKQAVLATAYGANLALPWDRDVVSRESMVVLLLATTAMGGLLVFKRQLAWAKATWLIGTLPFAAFVLLQTDAGHVYVSILPLLVVLLLVAASETKASTISVRAASGLLCALFVLSWFGRRPHQMWTHPRVIAEAQDVRKGTRTADPHFQTDVSAAMRWLEAKVAKDSPRCIGARPGLTVVHPLLRRGGPTQMGLRWNSTLQNELADELRAARCPLYVHKLHSFDVPESAWPLGEDFFALAELYEAQRRIGPALVGMTLRSSPAVPRIEVLEVTSLSPKRPVAIPGQVRVPLPKLIDGRHPLRLDYTLHMRRWRAFAGGTPLIKWRFSRDGKPLADWQYLFHMAVGERTRAYLSVEPEVTERRWLAGEDMQPTRSADTLELRAEPRGLASPKRIALTLHELGLVKSARDPVAKPPRRCNGEQDLLAAIKKGEAWPRQVSPRPDQFSFQLHPNGALEPPAEVFFPIVPCKESCFFAEVGIDTGGPKSDGATLETHIIDRGARPLLAKHWLKKGERRLIEIPLGGFAGRDVLLRLGSYGQDGPDGDFLWLSGARVMRCSARSNISESVKLGRANAVWGLIQAREGHVLTDNRGAEVQIPVRVIDDTCASVEFALHKEYDAKGGMDFFMDVVVDGLRHRMTEGRLEGKAPFQRASVSLHDFAGRGVSVHLGAKPAFGGGEFFAFLNPQLGPCQ